MARKVILMTKVENIHPSKIFSRVKNSFLLNEFPVSEVIFSPKYLREFINSSIVKRENEDGDQVTFVHVDGDTVYETTLTQKGNKEKDVFYVVDSIICKDPKVGVIYQRDYSIEPKAMFCFVKSPERGFNLLDRVEKHNKNEANKITARR